MDRALAGIQQPHCVQIVFFDELQVEHILTLRIASASVSLSGHITRDHPVIIDPIFSAGVIFLHPLQAICPKLQ